MANVTDEQLGDRPILASNYYAMPSDLTEAERRDYALRMARAAGCTCSPDIRRLSRAERRARRLRHTDNSEHHMVGHDETCRLYRQLLARCS